MPARCQAAQLPQEEQSEPHLGIDSPAPGHRLAQAIDHVGSVTISIGKARDWKAICALGERSLQQSNTGKQLLSSETHPNRVSCSRGRQ
jgi:hypothetical protein